MADPFELQAEVRKDVGKGASRRLRKANDLVPAIIYGAGKEAVSVTLAHKDLHKALQDQGFYSRIVTLKTGRKKEDVILKDLQRHPAVDRILHADFLRVSADQAINVHVPIRYLNEDLCEGVKTGGGVISHIMVEIEVSCLPADLPEFIEIDMESLDLGDSVRLSELQVPDAVELVGMQQVEEVDPTIVSVHLPRGGMEEEEEEEEEEELAEGEEAAEGAEDAAQEGDKAPDQETPEEE
jgi:large subunit ribosomal protein L25|tara:strand:- start:114 stop:830 length:717 start_codon:yes stop_codon:yes gene_type:complete